MAFGGKFKVGDLVTIGKQPFVWTVMGHRLNVRERSWKAVLSRDAGWATISMTVDEAKVVPA